MNVGCPTCGADVEFRFDDSFVRICGSCRSAVLRTDRGVETLGKLADLVPIQSPLKLFAEGHFGSTSFLLVGMAQLKHAAGGIWQEWYAKLDGGQWAWLSEAQGRYYWTYELPDQTVPVYQSLRPGTKVTLHGRQFTVGEMGSATYASAAGEIPYRLVPTETFWFVDLADGLGGFATIDYGTDGVSPTVYLGSQIELKDLGLYGGEDLQQQTARVVQGGKLACPNCGGSLELRAPDATLRVACPYCNHLVSVESGNLSVIARLAKKASPRIPLGTKGKFPDGEMQVIGFVERSALVDHSWWAFEEYLLHAPGVGFRWLVLSDGHWSYVQPVAPGAVELAPIKYDGVEFELFQRADLRVDVVLGEFYWQVEQGERVIGEDYVAPPCMLSCETSKTEQTWSLSTYMKPREVQDAFAPAAIIVPSPIGVAPNQPYTLHGVGKIGAAAFVALLAIGMIRCNTASNDLKHAQRAEIQPTSPFGTPTPSVDPSTGVGSAEAAPNVVFTEPFHLDGGKNIKVDLSANVSNNWAYVAVDLVNEKTGSLVSFDKAIEYYYGYDGGEYWSEGGRSESQILGPMEAGEYVIRLEGQTGSTTVVDLDITVRQDVFRMLYWGVALGLLGIPFGLLFVHHRSFKRKQWENSSPVRSTELSGSDYDDDDDDDDDD